MVFLERAGLSIETNTMLTRLPLSEGYSICVIPGVYDVAFVGNFPEHEA
jgi:hypothetical protein